MVAALLLLGAVPAMSADLPDAQSLRDLSDAAAGPAPTAYHEELTFDGTAVSGKETVFARAADRRVIEDAGPFHTESGTNAGEHWHENANGHVVIDEADPGLATREPLTTSVTRTTQPLDAFVISTLNAKGYGDREFIDPASHHIVRRETLTPNGKIVTAYDDFAAFGKRHLPRHWRIDDEPDGTHTEFFRRDYVAGDVAESDVAIPSMKRPLVEYPAGVDRVVLPAVFSPSGHIVVRLTIAGRGLDFFLDTGSATIALDPGVANALKLNVIAKQQSSSNAGRFNTGRSIVPLITIGSLQMHDTVVSIVPLGFVEPGTKVVGLLGFDFLCESGITIDYEHQTVTAERYGTYSAPQTPRTIVLAARLGQQIPMTTVNVNGAVAERMMLDTGAAGPFLLFDYFARRHPEALPRGSGAVSFTGAGGQFYAQREELDSVTIGNVAFKHFTGFVVTSRASYSGNDDGVIGPDFLRYFDVHLDYPNGTIDLVPNASGEKSMR